MASRDAAQISSMAPPAASGVALSRPHIHDAGRHNGAVLRMAKLQVHAASDERRFQHRAAPVGSFDMHQHRLGAKSRKMCIRDRAKHAASPLADVIEGFRFVMGNPPIHHLLILLGILSATGMPFAVLMPIFADQILHGGARRCV